MSGYWFDRGVDVLEKTRETQLELAEWVEVGPRRWGRRMKDWEAQR